MIKQLLGVMRGPFLLLVPACLAPAFAVAYAENGALDLRLAVLIFIAGLAAHIAVNALNEYEDFSSGLDFATKRTPFSGGSGTLVKDTEFAPMALYTGLVGLLVTFTIGIYFMWQLSAAVVMPGLLGLAIIVAYTRWINRFPLLCLVAPGVAFGLLMVNLSTLVLTGSVSATSLWTSLPVTFLVSNLLLLNQFPDIDADRRVGRKHLAIAWGIPWAARTYTVFMLLAFASIVAGCLAGALPFQTKLALLTLPAGLWVALRALKFDGKNIEALVPAMGVNVAVTLLTPVLLAAGVFWAAL